MPLTANEIWRDFNTDGVPASGAHKPIKADIRAWGTQFEAAGGFNAPGADTTAALFSMGAGVPSVFRKIVGFDLPNPSTTTPGAVFAKPTVAGQVLTGLGADGEFETGTFTANDPNFTGSTIKFNGVNLVGVSGGAHVFYAPDGRFGVQLGVATNNYRATTHSFQDLTGGDLFATFDAKGLTLSPANLTGAAADPAFSFTQTWNTTGVAIGADWSFIETAQSLVSRAFRIRGGSAGTKELFSLLIGDPTNPAFAMNSRTVFAAPDGNANFIYSTTVGIFYINAAGSAFLNMVSNAGVWSFMGTTSGSHTLAAAAAASGASTFPNVSGELINTGFGVATLNTIIGVDWNAAAGTEYVVPIKVPGGFTKFRIGGAAFNTGPGAASLTTAQVAGYTATGAGGTAVFLPQALNTLTSNSPGVPGSYINLTVNPAVGALHYFDIATVPNFYFRITTPQGAAALGKLLLTITAVG